MSALLVLFVIGAIIFIGYFAEVLFRKTKIPDILLLILIGIILARLFPLEESGISAFIPVFTSFALVFILFEGAIRLDVKHLLQHLPKSIVLTVTSFSLSAVSAVFVGLHVLGLTFYQSLFAGFILGGISSSIVIPMVRFLQLSDTTDAALTLESALSDVLCIVSTIILIEFLLLPEVSLSGFANFFLSIAIVSLVFGVLAGLAWVYVLRRYAPANSYILTIALLVMLFAATEALGYSGAMGCLAFGIVLGNARVSNTFLRRESEDGKKEEHHVFSRQVLTSTARVFYAQISFFVKTFFFVYIGMAIDFSRPLPLLFGGLMVLGAMFLRPIAVWVSHVTKVRREAAYMEAMIPKGTAAAVLAALPLQRGVEGAAVLPDIVTGGIAASIIYTAVLVYLVSSTPFRGLYRWGRFREDNDVPVAEAEPKT